MSRAEKRALREMEKAKASARRRRWLLLLAGVAGLGVLFVALPIVLVTALVAGLLLVYPDRFWPKVVGTVGAVAGLLGLLAVPAYWSGYNAVLGGHALTGDFWIVGLCSMALGLAPGAVTSVLVRRWRESQPLRGQQLVSRRTELEDSRRRRSAHRTQAWAHDPGSSRTAVVRQKAAAPLAVPLGDSRGPYLGIYQRGELDSWCTRRSRLQPPCGSQAWHWTVLGASQQGKSETVFRMEEWFLQQHPDGQIIGLNCKEAAPGQEPARRLLAHATALGRSSNALIRGYSPYDIMRGTTSEIRQRLMDVELFSEPHHEAGTNLVLALGLEMLTSKGRPATELEDVLQEVADRSRVQQWASQSEFAARLVEMIDPASWRGAVTRYASDALDLFGWIGGRERGGWAFEDQAVSALDLPTSREPKTAQMLLRLLLQDVVAYLTHPRRPQRADGSYVPLLVVLEELSAVDTDPVIMRKIVNLMERALQADVRFIVVAQDVHGLGNEQTQDRVLQNSTAITYTQRSNVDKLVMLAGTRSAPEASGTYNGRLRAVQAADAGSLRMQESFTVHPNELRDLERGSAFVFHNGRYAKFAATKAPMGFGVPNSQVVMKHDHQLRLSRSDNGSTSRDDDGDQGSGSVLGDEV